MKYALSLLAVLTLSACAAPSLPVAPTPANGSLQARSITHSDGRITVGTAKTRYDLALEKALSWSPNAELSHVEGRYISANGLNDYFMDAIWVFSFVDRTNASEAVRVHFRSEFTQPVLQKVSRASLPAREPLEERAWAYDSNKALNAARAMTEMIIYPVPHMELTMEQGSLVWKIHAGMYGTVMLDAMNGRPPLRR